MSVATKNPFALLNDDESLEVEAGADPAPTPVTQPPARNTQKQRGGGPAARGGKYYSRGGKAQAPKETTAEEPVAENQRKSEGAREGGYDGRGRGRGRGRDGPGRGRPFDRHSQTGKTDSEKKIHQSWGGGDGETEFKTEEAATFDAAAEATNNDWGTSITNNSTSGEWGTTTADDWGTPAEPNTDAWGTSDPAPAEGNAKSEQPRGRREKEPEEEDNTLTFDQYLAQQKDKDSAIPKLESIRKANDGADDIWNNAIPLSKNEDEVAYYVGKSKSIPKSRTKKEEKVYIEIDARFERPDRGRGRGRGHGDRERGHGNRGRGGKFRQDANGPAPAVDVEDRTVFPSLTSR